MYTRIGRIGLVTKVKITFENLIPQFGYSSRVPFMSTLQTADFLGNAPHVLSRALLTLCSLHSQFMRFTLAHKPEIDWLYHKSFDCYQSQQTLCL